MKRVLTVSLFALILSKPAFSVSMSTTYDTVRFANTEVYVVEHTLKHYYFDSLCVWEITYPQFHGMADKTKEFELNDLFSKKLSFGDCNDVECDLEAMKRIQENAVFWNSIRVHCIKGNVISYVEKSGGCRREQPMCKETTQTHLYDYVNNEAYDENLYFKKDPKSVKKLNDIIIKKLGFTPKDVSKLQTDWKLDVDCDGVSIFYDCETIFDFNQYLIYLSFDDLWEVLHPQGPLVALRLK